MKEKAIKINIVSLGLSGLAFLTILYFSVNVSFTESATAMLSFIVMFVVCITSLYRAFKDNENPIKAIQYTFNYFLNKVIK